LRVVSYELRVIGLTGYSLRLGFNLGK